MTASAAKFRPKCRREQHEQQTITHQPTLRRIIVREDSLTRMPKCRAQDESVCDTTNAFDENALPGLPRQVLSIFELEHTDDDAPFSLVSANREVTEAPYRVMFL